MGKPTPQETFDDAGQQRTKYPLTLPGNPYKLKEAGEQLRAYLDTARAVLDYERHPVKGGASLLLGSSCCCLAFERRWWTQRALREGIAFVLGYDALPGLEVMDRPDLLKKFRSTVLNRILPAATAGLALPKGPSTMECLIAVAESALALVDQTLAALQVPYD